MNSASCRNNVGKGFFLTFSESAPTTQPFITVKQKIPVALINRAGLTPSIKRLLLHFLSNKNRYIWIKFTSQLKHDVYQKLLRDLLKRPPLLKRLKKCVVYFCKKKKKRFYRTTVRGELDVALV